MNIFEGLTREQIMALHDTPSYITVPAGDVIFSQGDKAFGLFIVVEGKVEIYRSGAEGEQSLTTLGAGEVFGEIGLIIESGERTASARAVERSLLLGVPGDPEEFRKRIADSGTSMRIMKNLVCILGRHLRAKDDEDVKNRNRRVPILDASMKGQKEALDVMRKALPKHGLFRKVAAERTLLEGEFLCRQGDEPDGFYFLHNGAVDVIDDNAEGGPVVLARQKAPNVTGELGFFSGEKRMASLRAAEPLTYTLFSGKDFDKLVKKKEGEALGVLIAAARLVVHLIVEREELE